MGPNLMIDLSKDIKFCAEFCYSKGSKKVCQIYCGKDPRPVPWDSPLQTPPPPPLVPVEVPLTQAGLNEKELFTSIVVIVSCVIGGAIILGALLAFLRECCYKRNNSRRRNPNPPILFATGEDFLDEEQGGRVIDHPIWYINTVGLQQSVIDLISVVKYKKDEGLIEGTDCSVCLGEFLEDEGLRLLPKCSHAFHVSCIDTWLRSHKNCPLCRAPVINEAAIPQSDEVAPRSGSGEENRAGDSESEIELSRTIHAEEDDTSNERMEDYRIDDDLPIEEKNHAQNSGSLHHLGDNNLSVVDEDLQPVRRSASLDSFADSSIYKIEKCHENSLSGIGSKRMIGNSSTRELMKSSSVVGSSSLQKESSGRFFFSSKSRRSQSSILPL